MGPKAKAALKRVILDAEYRCAVEDWIASKTIDNDTASADGWIGKRDAAGAPVMNICTGGDPVTVPISLIRHVLTHGRVPDETDRTNRDRNVGHDGNNPAINER